MVIDDIRKLDLLLKELHNEDSELSKILRTTKLAEKMADMVVVGGGLETYFRELENRVEFLSKSVTVLLDQVEANTNTLISITSISTPSVNTYSSTYGSLDVYTLAGNIINTTPMYKEFY